MECSDIRWQLRQFLEGGLPQSQELAVRDHLDSCPDCVSYLINSNMIDRLQIDVPGKPATELMDRVVAETATLDSGSLLSRWLYYIFGAASLLGISVFAFVRYYLSPAALSGFDEKLPREETFTRLFPWLAEWVSSPAFTYLLLSLGAVLLSVSLILAVDLFGQLFPSRKKSL